MTVRVAVFGLGGTIAMAASPGGAAAGGVSGGVPSVPAASGVVPALSAEDLVAGVPGLAATGIEVAVHDFRSLPSASLTFADLRELRAAIDAQMAAGVTGVVVTQGTDTLEETAYALDLTHRHETPVVLTGAMRNPTQAGPDGSANLLAAVHTAADERARGQGVLVAFADDIHAASRVRKAHSTSVSAFVSVPGGPLGQVVEGRPRWLNRLADRTVLPPSTEDTRDARVALVVASFDDDGSLLPVLADRCDGLVVAGFGAGHVPRTWIEPLTGLIARMPVVLASRTGAGPVLTGTYGYPGSEADLLTRGLVSAGFLDAYKARILLRLALTAGLDRRQIDILFAEAGGMGASGQR